MENEKIHPNANSIKTKLIQAFSQNTYVHLG